MKKLMTAFAACMLAGIVSAQVQSQNIVGYQTLTGNAGYTVVAPTFVSVGDTLGQLTYSQITGEFQDTDNIQIFDVDGNVAATAIWLTAAGLYGVPTDGWYADDYSTAKGSDLIPAGAGFFVSMANGGNIVIAGQVSQSAVVVPTVSGYTVTGNCRPYDITYGNLDCVGLQDTDNIQIFDVDGNVSATAIWLTAAGLYGVPSDGWYADDYSTSKALDVIPAGQGFFVSCADVGTITIPAPVL